MGPNYLLNNLENLCAPPDLRGELERISSALSKKKYSLLFSQGQGPQGIYLICKGQAKLYLRSSTGRLLAYRVVGSGTVLGLPSPICNTPYSMTAEALEDCTLAFIPRSKALQLLRAGPKLCLDVVEMLGHEVQAMKEALVRRERTQARFKIEEKVSPEQVFGTVLTNGRMCRQEKWFECGLTAATGQAT